MKKNARFIFLGTGGSMGIPVIGCSCEVCLSSNVKDKRTRSSGLLKIDDKTILIDCGPDFRSQALVNHLDHLDGIIFTHAHQDHTGGIDDLRAFYSKLDAPLPCLLSQETADDIMQRFSYIFRPNSQFTSKLDFTFLRGERGEMNFLGFPFTYLSYEQMGMVVNGFRFGNFAYISDIRHYPESIFEDLQGIHTLVVSALRFTPSEVHFTVDEAVDFAQKLGVKHTWLTHLSHDLEHDRTNAYLPPDIRMAYDGLEINLLEI